MHGCLALKPYLDARDHCNRTCVLQLFKFGSSWPVAGAQGCLSKWARRKGKKQCHFSTGIAWAARFKVWDMFGSCWPRYPKDDESSARKIGSVTGRDDCPSPGFHIAQHV